MRHHADADLTPPAQETRAPPEASVLRRLRLSRVRNLAAIDFRPEPGWNRIEAANGAGKTSLLEAIYVASTGRSFRTAELSDLRPRGGAGEGAAATEVVAEVERDGLWEIAFVLDHASSARTLQGHPAALAETLAKLPLVVWSEAERELVRGADRERRRLFDRALLLLDPPSVAAEAEHARVWRQKRRLLALPAADAGELAAWNELLAPHLARRAAARARLSRELEAAANAALAAAGADLPPLALRYSPSPAEAGESAPSALAALAARAGEERQRGAPLVGPQRDRVAIELGRSATRRQASAGEQKIVALALLAALERLLAARGRAPLVLLDDLESELDPRRAAVAADLFSPAIQVVSTSSRAAEIPPFPAVRWRLENGQINRL